MFAALALSFAVIFVAELGDKSQLMAMTFALRYRWWVVLTAILTATTLVLGIDSDRLFPVDGQHRIARGIRSTIDDGAVVLSSDFGHDGFLIETAAVGAHLRRLLQT